MMKSKTELFFLFCIVFLGGGVLARFYPLLSFGINKDFILFEEVSSDLESKDISKGFISQQTEMDHVFDTLMEMSQDVLEKEIFILFSGSGQNTDFNVSLQLLLERLLRDHPQKAVMLLCSKPFMKTNENVRKKTVEIIFFHLAIHYHECFNAVILFLKKEPDSHFNEYAVLAVKSFFAALKTHNSELLYRYITDGSMDEWKVIICGDAMDDASKSFDQHYTNLRQELISSMGIQDRSVLFEELSYLPTSKSFNNERRNLISGFVKGMNEGSKAEVLVWAMENLKTPDKEVFIEVYFDSLRERNAGAAEIIFFIKNIDRNWMGEKNLFGPSQVAVAQMAKNIARTDTSGAIELINVGLIGFMREKALLEVLVQVNENTPVQEMLPIINRLSDGTCKTTIAMHFLGKYYNESPDQAVAWVRENFTYEDQESLLYSVQGTAYQRRIIIDANGKPQKPFIRFGRSYEYRE